MVFDKLIGPAIIVAGVASGLVPTKAEAYCGQHDVIKGYLEAFPTEARVRGLGVTSDQLGLVELYVAPDGRFAITVTAKDKTSCTLLTGSDWVGADGEVMDDPATPNEGEE